MLVERRRTARARGRAARAIQGIGSTPPRPACSTCASTSCVAQLLRAVALAGKLLVEVVLVGGDGRAGERDEEADRRLARRRERHDPPGLAVPGEPDAGRVDLGPRRRGSAPRQRRRGRAGRSSGSSATRPGSVPPDAPTPRLSYASTATPSWRRSACSSGRYVARRRPEPVTYATAARRPRPGGSRSVPGERRAAAAEANGDRAESEQRHPSARDRRPPRVEARAAARRLGVANPEPIENAVPEGYRACTRPAAEVDETRRPVRVVDDRERAAVQAHRARRPPEPGRARVRRRRRFGA